MLKRTAIAAAMLVYLCSSQSYADVINVSGTLDLLTSTDTLSIDGDSFELSLDLTNVSVTPFGGPFSLAVANSIQVAVDGTGLVGPTPNGGSALLLNSGTGQGFIIPFNPTSTSSLDFTFNGNAVEVFGSNIEFSGLTAPAVSEVITADAFDSATIGFGPSTTIFRFTDAAGDTDYTISGLSFTVVPEPSTFLVLGTMTGMLFVRRKR